MLRALLFVGIGGFAGSALRYMISVFTARYVAQPFPWATLIVNAVGCLIIGLLYGVGQKNQWLTGEGWLLLATGFCGGFTTFSAFALENINLLRSGQTSTAMLYILLSVLAGIAFCLLGIWLTKA